MKRMIAICGLDCSKCEAFLATKNNNDAERKSVAEKWCKLYRPGIKPEDINCDGCQSEGVKLFNYCRVCEIRKCGIEKGLENCAYCKGYPCKKLEDFFKHAPDAKDNLNEIRKERK